MPRSSHQPAPNAHDGLSRHAGGVAAAARAGAARPGGAPRLRLARAAALPALLHQGRAAAARSAAVRAGEGGAQVGHGLLLRRGRPDRRRLDAAAAVGRALPGAPPAEGHALRRHPDGHTKDHHDAHAALHEGLRPEGAAGGEGARTGRRALRRRDALDGLVRRLCPRDRGVEGGAGADARRASVLRIGRALAQRAVGQRLRPEHRRDAEGGPARRRQLQRAALADGGRTPPADEAGLRATAARAAASRDSLTRDRLPRDRLTRDRLTRLPRNRCRSISSSAASEHCTTAITTCSPTCTCSWSARSASSSSRRRRRATCTPSRCTTTTTVARRSISTRQTRPASPAAARRRGTWSSSTPESCCTSRPAGGTTCRRVRRRASRWRGGSSSTRAASSPPPIPTARRPPSTRTTSASPRARAV